MRKNKEPEVLKSMILTARVDPGLHQRMVAYASRTRRPLSSLCAMLVETDLRKLPPFELSERHYLTGAVVIGFRVTEETKDALNAEASRRFISLSFFCHQLFLYRLKETEKGVDVDFSCVRDVMSLLVTRRA